MAHTSSSNGSPNLQQSAETDNALPLVNELTATFYWLTVDEKPFVALSKACYSGDMVHIEVLLKHYSKLCDDGNSCIAEKCLFCSFRKGGIKVVEFIRKYGIGKVVSDFHGDCLSFTPLMLACERNHYEIVELLIKCGAQVHRQDEHLTTPLMIACRLGHEKVVEILVQYLDRERIDSHNADNMTAMAYACRYGYLGIVRTLLQHRASVNYTIGRRESLLLYLSAYSNDNQSQLVKLLLENGVDVNAATVDGDTALLRSVSGENKKVVKTLLEYGADICAANSDGKTALMICFEKRPRDAKMLKLLFQHGHLNNLDRRDKFGRTVLMYACMSGEEHIVQKLLAQGANVDVQDNSSNTAIMLALEREADCQNDKCVQALVKADADLDVVNEAGNTVFSIALERHFCLQILLQSRKLIDQETDTLKSVHKNAFNPSFTMHRGNLQIMMKYGIFEWAWYPLNLDFHIDDANYLLPISIHAMEHSICPGKICYGGFEVSPLVFSFLCNHLKPAKLFIKRLYFFPEDYNMLISRTQHRFLEQVKDSPTLKELTHQPLSLVSWSVLTISKAVSTAGPPTKRLQRVESLPIPEVLKSKLLFRLWNQNSRMDYYNL